MNTSPTISESTADTLYDAATAQYAFHTLERLRRKYDLAAPREQENIDYLIERGAQIVFNSDLPEAYVAIDEWQQINPRKWGIDDWAYAIREIFIEDNHVSVGAFAGACHFNGTIAYETFYPLNPTDEQLAEARDKAERYTTKAATLLANNWQDKENGKETPMANTISFIEREKAANNRAYANTKARTAARKALQAAYNTLVENGAYEDAMNGLDWAEKARYENAVTEIVDLLRVMPLNESAARSE